MSAVNMAAAFLRKSCARQISKPTTMNGPAHPALPKLKLYIGGLWREGRGASLTLIEPATGEKLGEIANASSDDVDDAVAAAQAAYPGWRDTPALERAAILKRAAQRLRDNVAELALLETRNTGNPIAVMEPEVGACADFVDFFAGLTTEMKGTTIPISSRAFSMTVREPLGVVARICAFNHPLLYATAKAASALAVGNTVIIKPSDLTPLTALKAAELWSDLFPPGAYNVLPGDLATGRALVEHAGVAKISLIGSPAAGRAVMQAAGATLKKLTLELGGKNALIACADANPAAVAEAIVRGMNFRSVTGQSCGSTSRVYLHESIHDDVVARITTLIRKLRIGQPTDSTTDVGCLSSEAQFKKSLDYIEIGKREGARLVIGGGRPAAAELARGYFVEPTVFSDVTEEMRIASEEIFGPVLSVLRWSNEENVIARTNATPFGLTASIFTRDFDRAHSFASKLQAGYVWINDSAAHNLGVPFGGSKQSGFGREESIEEMFEFTQSKTINVRLIS
ncbi:aldehyde dehydrogenase family protein [Terrarubrum flagellatum]|uniref:aldehyde dehydrogenase family protein n=1 Tax=Terrirubrum flagellatum TaxID=2895980 RepID=UPI0031451171